MSASFDASYGIKKITSTDYLMNTQEQTYFNLLFKRNTGTSNTYDDTTLLDLYRSLQYYHNDTNLWIRFCRQCCHTKLLIDIEWR